MAGNFWKSSHAQQWVLEKFDLLRERGEDLKLFSEDEYQKLMIFFTNLIHQVGVTIDQRVRQPAIATACTYFRRFYARRSFKDADPFCMVATCLIMATKVDEFGMIGVTKTIGVLNSILHKTPSFPKDLAQPLAKHHVEEAEFVLLEIMDCCLIVYHPYRPLNIIVQDMKNNGVKDVDQLYADAWRVVNDSLRTDAGLLYAPHVLAMASIMTAALFARRDTDLVSWLAELNVDFEKVFECQQVLLVFYRLQKTYTEKEVVEDLLKRVPRPLPINKDVSMKET